MHVEPLAVAAECVGHRCARCRRRSVWSSGMCSGGAAGDGRGGRGKVEDEVDFMEIAGGGRHRAADPIER